MNLAFGALFSFILLFPGFIFRSAYLGGPYARRTIASSLVDELIWSLAPAFILQSVGYLFVEKLTTLDVNELAIYQLVTAQSSLDKSILGEGIPRFFGYQLAISLLATLLGGGSNWLVKNYKLDCRYYFLRVNNDWYYLLTGRILDFPDMAGNSDEVSAVHIDVIIDAQACSYLYTGVLATFYLSREQGLDRIYLKNVYRRKLSDDVVRATSPPTPDRAFDDRYYQMPGDLFVISYSSIKTINVSYVSIQEADE